MKRVQIKVTIDKKGKVTMEGTGFEGKKCDAEMGRLEDALGVVTDRQNKPEYHNSNNTDYTYNKS